MEAYPKSVFKARAFEIFREVETTGAPVIITDRGTPVLKLIPYRETPEERLGTLRYSVLEYTAPTEPVSDGEWGSGVATGWPG